jgi:haloacetate dehalogenase
MMPTWNDEEAMKSRNFLGGLTVASLGVVLEGSLTECAIAQSTAQRDTSVAGQAPFTTSQVEASGNTIFVRRYGKGPAILMVHGFPRRSLMWRFLAPRLAENHTVICVNLRA